MKNIITILLCFFYLTALQAQDPQFSQFYSNPMYLNPSLAGIKDKYRITINHRQQWGLDHGYTTSSFSLDGNAGTNSGWGLQMIDDNQMKVINTNAMFGTLAHRVNIKKEMQIGMGVGINYYHQSYHWHNLIFEDQLDPRLGQVNATHEQFENQQMNSIDFSAGMIFTSKNSVAGVSLKHINKTGPMMSSPNRIEMPLKLTIHAATNLVSKNRIRKPFYLSPNIIYEKQGPFEYWNLGMYYANENWVLGGWYRVNEALILSLGVNIKDFRLAYSYDYVISQYGDTMRNSNEIALTYQFDIPFSKKIKNRYKGKCPEFYKHIL